MNIKQLGLKLMALTPLPFNVFNKVGGVPFIEVNQSITIDDLNNEDIPLLLKFYFQQLIS